MSAEARVVFFRHPMHLTSMHASRKTLWRFSRFSVAAQSVLYVASGINHFWHRDFYVAIMPEHYHDPEMWIALTGAAEIAGGLGLLVPATRKAAAIGLIAMLTAFLDVHVNMLRHPEKFHDIPEWAIVGRIPLQFALMAWAWSAGKTQAETTQAEKTRG